MKCKNLLILSSIFVANALPESFFGDFNKLGSTNASLGRIEVGYKGLFYPNLLIVGGFDATFNLFLGVGYIQNMEYSGWPLEFKVILYCFDWANKSFSKEYISKMPISLSVSTNIWGFNFGTSVSCSFNKKFLISAFVKFDLNDDYDVSLNYHAYGESDFFSKNSYKRASVQRLKKDSQKIVDEKAGFIPFSKEHSIPGEVHDEIIECFIEHARQTIKVCDYFLENKGSLKSIEEVQSNSLFLIGKSGAGKTHTYDLFKNFVDKNKLYSISLITLNASSFTPEGYKGDNINDKIPSLFNENIKNSKNYQHNAVSISRSIILVDEIDNISERNGGSDSDNFYTRVQKAMLDFVEGKQIYKTDVGLIPVFGCLKILPGAFESRSGELERKVINKTICEKDSFLISKLVESLINYIKTNHITEHSDCEDSFNKLVDAAQYVDELITKELDKDPNFTAFKRGDKDKDLRSVDEIYKFLESNKVFSSLKNPHVYQEIKHFSNLFKDMKKKLNTIKTTKTGKTFSVDPNKFDDLYVRIFDILGSLDSNIETRSNEILEVAVENHKRKNALFCISESGMGSEIIRRAAKVFYLEKPSFLRAFKYLEDSKYAKLLNANKSNIRYIGFQIEEGQKNKNDGIDSCLRALLQSARGGNANNNEKYSFANLEALCKKGMEAFDYAFNVNGKVVAHLKKNGVNFYPDELDDDINITKVETLFNAEKSKLETEISAQTQSIRDLEEVYPSSVYDKLKKLKMFNTSTELEYSIDLKDLTELTEFVNEYRSCFLDVNKLQALCTSMLNLIDEKDKFNQVGPMSSLRGLVENSSDFLTRLGIKNIIDNRNTFLDSLNKFQEECLSRQEYVSEKLLKVLESLLSNLKKKNDLEQNPYKKGSNQTIEERINALKIDNKKKKQDVIDLYYVILSIVGKK